MDAKIRLARETPMKNLSVLLAAMFLLWVTLAALDQKNMSPPPPSLDADTKSAPNEPITAKRFDLVPAQPAADVLARTAQTIPSGVASVSKSMLPKDIIEKPKDRKALEARAIGAESVKSQSRSVEVSNEIVRLLLRWGSDQRGQGPEKLKRELNRIETLAKQLGNGLNP